MSSKLDVFNEAGRMLGQPRLNTLTPDPTPKFAREANQAWTATVEVCLEQTSFHFGMVRAQLARLTEVPSFGFAYYYQKPADMIRLISLSSNGRDFDTVGHESYSEESGKYATDYTALYARYVSRTAIEAVGRWSPLFCDFVAQRLAMKIAPQVNAGAIEVIGKTLQVTEKKAIAVDAAQQTRRQRRPGSWSTANRRHSRGGSGPGTGGSVSEAPEQN